MMMPTAHSSSCLLFVGRYDSVFAISSRGDGALACAPCWSLPPGPSLSLRLCPLQPGQRVQRSELEAAQPSAWAPPQPESARGESQVPPTFAPYRPHDAVGAGGIAVRPTVTPGAISAAAAWQPDGVLSKPLGVGALPGQQVKHPVESATSLMVLARMRPAVVIK